ncbi:hypothetical protein PR048_026360 [Dryococelus australis]|uniref:Phosphodiesterase n=1 Tax=Dryococelus australis TaxID=614101 RepID=A0ABQ9GL50_9NEOP|nr:hypothetical protein PR048_026360 [Dryococelus australis]
MNPRILQVSRNKPCEWRELLVNHHVFVQLVSEAAFCIKMSLCERGGCVVCRSIFQDMVSMDALVIKIMNFAQRLVDADRASLFLVDSKSQELYARVFDVGVSSSDEDGDNPSSDDVLQSVVPTPKEIRFPLGTGIAGQVALTGDVLNISDAYCDPRFNRAVDQLTGYRTHSILCMPIFIGDGVIGVVQMVNKHSGRFLKCCEVSWCLLGAVHTRRTQQEPVTRVEPGETECTAATHERAARHPLQTCRDVKHTTVFKVESGLKTTTNKGHRVCAYLSADLGSGGGWGVCYEDTRRLQEDEEAFEMFAVYCGLALHHAQLYDKIARSEQKYRVALDVLSYHNTCSEEEVGRILRAGVPECVPGLDHYYLDVFSLEDLEKARLAVYMFKDMFGLSRFDRDSVVRFTLTVRKNYRRVPYHNWTHGFSVANTTYSIIKHSPGIFTTLEALALYVASLCHDLDHRGKNNKFMLETESPLAAIYSTSTMEHHHFNQTVTILQQKGHNIFSKLTNSEYKQVLDFVKHCILATDLAVFFPNRAQLFELVSTNQFVWTSYRHRLLLQAITMTASDLSASAKPWDLQVKTVQVIFQEFYEQGDAERATGRIPIPMMDRNQPDQQAASQVGFLTGICIPCYSLLHQLIPSTQPLLDQCQSNLERWSEIDQQVVREKLEEVRRKQEEKNRRSDKEDEGAVSSDNPGAGAETKTPAADNEMTTGEAESVQPGTTACEVVPTDADQAPVAGEDPQPKERQISTAAPNTGCGDASDAQYYDGWLEVAETTLGNENGERGGEKSKQGIGEKSRVQSQTNGHQDNAS